MRHICWPDNKKFAFTVVDDTDGAFLYNIKPVYDYLNLKGIKTTKTIWIYESRNNYTGDFLLNPNKDYLKYLLFLKNNGFEIAFHNAGSGLFKREETIEGLETFRRIFGTYPKMHINHANNKENIYWGKDRFNGFVKLVYYLNRKKDVCSFGNDPSSAYFWGDFLKKNIKYIRNRTFNILNTLKADKIIVRKEKGKTEFSNYWFSASDAMDFDSFKRMLKKKNIDRLEKQRGCCILYTHFAYGFVDENGELKKEFRDIIDYLASKQGWFVPCSDLLDYIEASRKKDVITGKIKLAILDLKWLIERIFKRIITKK